MSTKQQPHLSRRAAVTTIGIGIGGFATVLAAGKARVVSAQEAVPELLDAWAAAWSSHDPEQLVALYAADAVYEEMPTATVARGHDEIREHVAASHAAFADIEVTPRRGFQTETWAVLEGDFAARGPEGQSISVPFAVILEIEDGAIVRSADYFDLNAVLTQMEASSDMATPSA
jgi:steroid delta-isomerase-like uncharacterized protein